MYSILMSGFEKFEELWCKEKIHSSEHIWNVNNEGLSRLLLEMSFVVSSMSYGLCNFKSLFE